MRPERLEGRDMGAGRLPGRAGRWLRRRLRKIFFRVLPRKSIYQRVLTPDFYSHDYFDRRKDPLRESGYGEALTYREEFREVAEVARDLFRPTRVLDMGCAKGFQVLALRRAGMEAWGIDISDYAVSEAPAEVEPYLKVEEYRKVHFPDQYFDLVLAMEVLEHIPPTDIRKVVEELHRLTSRWIWATIPCFGTNPFGPDGCLEGKIQPERISYYRKHVVDLASFRHLVRDIEGYPIHGHLIAASFDWWTALFTSLGFLRRGDLETEINRRLGPAREGIWNCLVFEKVREGSPVSLEPVRLTEADFSSGGNGTWSATLPALPTGVHRLDLELRVQWINWRKPDEDRLLSVRCTSPGGDRVLGMRLVSYGEARRRKSGRLLPVEMTLACPADTEVRMEVCMADESRVQPLLSVVGGSSSHLRPAPQEPV
ncbi:MAG: class I SAM-dependent methyltransferase [Actinobacteria bacterium]|nr:class I SAM-dependent methyltransferase [Actinomycetota bacterium]